jgi:hypothetical protein
MNLDAYPARARRRIRDAAEARPEVEGNVVAAFVLARRPIPRGIERRGFSAAESRMLDAHYKTYDPNGARAFDADRDAEMEQAIEME